MGTKQRCMSTQIRHAATQVLWARLLQMNGAPVEVIKESEMADVGAYLFANGRDEVRKDAIALLNEILMEQ
jgi:hypothetical protein